VNLFLFLCLCPFICFVRYVFCLFKKFFMKLYKNILVLTVFKSRHVARQGCGPANVLNVFSIVLLYTFKNVFGHQAQFVSKGVFLELCYTYLKCQFIFVMHVLSSLDGVQGPTTSVSMGVRDTESVLMYCYICIILLSGRLWCIVTSSIYNFVIRP